MKKFLLFSMLIATVALQPFDLRAQAPAAAPAAPTPPPPSLEQRVGSLEAYVNNGDPTAVLKDKDGNIPKDLTTPTVGVPGPGHNAWMMASAALVLFMTLPGLFLFYGGLVRRKNVLSVIAQCFGIAGLVTILWVVFGYSTVFSGSGGDNIGKEDIIKGVVGTDNIDCQLGDGLPPELLYSLPRATISMLGAWSDPLPMLISHLYLLRH